MQRFITRNNVRDNEHLLDTAIKDLLSSPQNKAILRADHLKGRKPNLPVFPERAHEIIAFKAIAP
jgi:hypothetical protein